MAERLIVESSVEEEGKGEKRENGGLSTPESKRTAAGEAPVEAGDAVSKRTEGGSGGSVDSGRGGGEEGKGDGIAQAESGEEVYDSES